jgi:hypothetical protein
MIVSPPPQWLAVGLQYFKEGITGPRLTAAERKQFDSRLERMQKSVDYLIKQLPTFNSIILGIQAPKDVTVALEVLPRISALLASRLNRSKRDVKYRMCAAVVVKAWQIVHGNLPQRSELLYEICEAYWLACGQDPRVNENTNFANWRRDVEAGGQDWIGEILLAVQNLPPI